MLANGLSLFIRLRSLLQSRYLTGNSVKTRYALAEACLIGIVSAFAALFLKQGINWVGSWRIAASAQFGAAVTLPLTGLVFGLLAGWCIEYLSPASAGGGIPQVKAALAQFPIPLSLRVAAVKAIGTILILGAGMTLGRRGPTVHIGAALAAQLSSWLPTSPEHRRQMIAAGAAAGLAAGFNTPIAGVLFVVEELMRDISGLTLETAILASVTGAVVSRFLGSTDLNLPLASIGSLGQSSFSAAEIPFYLLLGTLAGFLGALFNRGILSTASLFRRLNLAMSWRFAIAGVISGSIIAFLPPFFQNNAGLRDFLITGEAGWRFTAIAFVANFCLTILAYGSGAPGGLFAPCLVMGSALGYLFGSFHSLFSDLGSVHSYAFAGMGAFFTGVARIPVTAIVIVFEITTDFYLVLPLMIACMAAYIVGEGIFKGSIYQHLLQASGISLKDDPVDRELLTGLTAADVMQSQVETLNSNLSAQEVLKAMSRSHHRGFPVIEKGKLVGIVTQSDLAKQQSNAEWVMLKDIMTPQPITVRADASLSDVLYLLNNYQLSRLPVTEGRKLIGIITRTDIIRAEVDKLSGKAPNSWQLEPSYTVYQTRSPQTDKGRLLLPLANPNNATALMTIAAAIASDRDLEIDCLQVIRVPRHSSPAQTQVNTTKSRKLFYQIERLGRKWQIPVHTQIVIAHDLAQTILDIVDDRHIEILLMGWKGSASTSEHIFGTTVDKIIQQAPCEVVLIKQGKEPTFSPNSPKEENTWLIPVAGGPNVQSAISLLPALVAARGQSQSLKILLCQVHLRSLAKADFTYLEETAKALRDRFDFPIIPIPIYSASVSEAVINLAKTGKCNVVMLGASREGLLKQTIYGNIPESIALKVDSTVILVRGSIVRDEG